MAGPACEQAVPLEADALDFLLGQGLLGALLGPPVAQARSATDDGGDGEHRGRQAAQSGSEISPICKVPPRAGEGSAFWAPGLVLGANSPKRHAGSSSQSARTTPPQADRPHRQHRLSQVKPVDKLMDKLRGR